MIFCQEPDRPHKTYITIGQDDPGKVLGGKKIPPTSISQIFDF